MRLHSLKNHRIHHKMLLTLMSTRGKLTNEVLRSNTESSEEKLSTDESVICYGLGVTDPKRVFGTTTDLHKEFGEERVFDMPTSENAMTGVGIGQQLWGIK